MRQAPPQSLASWPTQKKKKKKKKTRPHAGTAETCQHLGNGPSGGTGGHQASAQASGRTCHLITPDPREPVPPGLRQHALLSTNQHLTPRTPEGLPAPRIDTPRESRRTRRSRARGYCLSPRRSETPRPVFRHAWLAHFDGPPKAVLHGKFIARTDCGVHWKWSHGVYESRRVPCLPAGGSRLYLEQLDLADPTTGRRRMTDYV